MEGGRECGGRGKAEVWREGGSMEEGGRLKCGGRECGGREGGKCGGREVWRKGEG